VAQALGRESDALDDALPLAELGVDSVQAVSLKARLERKLAIRLPATFLFAHPTLEAAAHNLARRVGIAPEVDAREIHADSDPRRDGAALSEIAQEVRGMSEAELLAEVRR